MVTPGKRKFSPMSIHHEKNPTKTACITPREHAGILRYNTVSGINLTVRKGEKRARKRVTLLTMNDPRQQSLPTVWKALSK